MPLIPLPCFLTKIQLLSNEDEVQIFLDILLSIPHAFRSSRERLLKSNRAPWVRGVISIACGKVKYNPLRSFICLWYWRACSSDQKKTELFQKASIMLGSSSLSISTRGTKTSGSASVSSTR
jgi:hypothetical protein